MLQSRTDFNKTIHIIAIIAEGICSVLFKSVLSWSISTAVHLLHVLWTFLRSATTRSTQGTEAHNRTPEGKKIGIDKGFYCELDKMSKVYASSLGCLCATFIVSVLIIFYKS